MWCMWLQRTDLVVPSTLHQRVCKAGIDAQPPGFRALSKNANVRRRTLLVSGCTVIRYVKRYRYMSRPRCLSTLLLERPVWILIEGSLPLRLCVACSSSWEMGLPCSKLSHSQDDSIRSGAIWHTLASQSPMTALTVGKVMHWASQFSKTTTREIFRICSVSTFDPLARPV